MKNIDSEAHVRGESLFLDDLGEPDCLCYAAVVAATRGPGKIKELNTAPAAACDGVVAVLRAEDIPGENQIGGILPDEPLLADETIHYIGQPVAVVVAVDRRAALRAARLVTMEIEVGDSITDPRIAYQKGQLITPPRTFSLGDVDQTWKDCDLVVSGRVDSGAQEHFYLEPQAAMALPTEKGGIKVFSSTQSPTGVQRAIAKVVAKKMHDIQVEVGRLGGAFGGKEDQATPWATMAALAAMVVRKPVKIVLSRRQDIVMTGKRHPYSSNFKIGLNNQGKILAYQVVFYQNAGASADLSTAILERTLFHVTNTYYIPNVRATGISCRTHLPPFTAFRGFGAPQAMFVIEAAIVAAAAKLGISPHEIQKKNLLNEGDVFPYGMAVEEAQARRCWSIASDRYDFTRSYNRAQEYNSRNTWMKKGVAIMPVCFGISFTNTMLNQGGALVHVYTDGSVSVSTGAVEMGQGVNAKLLEIASRTFSIDRERIKIETTDTTRVANTSPTAASTGADLNGKAAQLACESILARLMDLAGELLPGDDKGILKIKDEYVCRSGKKTSLTWPKLVLTAYQKRINLSAQAHYATPEIYFDRQKEKGQPFAYHVFGTSITEVSLDCLRGIYTIDAVKLVHDGGKSIHPLVDRGQVEGGVIQGIGWLTMEEIIYSDKGVLLTDSAAAYKVPDIKFTPKDFEALFLENVKNPKAVLDSKAVGELPFMYGIGAYFAILAAIRAFNPDSELPIVSPLTPERVLEYLYNKST